MIIPFIFTIFFMFPNLIDKTYAHTDDEINPTEVGPCYKYGVHKMYPKTTATVKYKDTGKNALALGTLYRCACNSEIVTEGRPPGSPIGKYVPNPTADMGVAGHDQLLTPRNKRKRSRKYTKQ